jgi:hypothetical protein
MDNLDKLAIVDTRHRTQTIEMRNNMNKYNRCAFQVIKSNQGMLFDTIFI